MTTKPTQLFGTVDSPTGQASAMICIDSDRPHEYMIYSWGYDNPVALLFDAETDSAGSSISLKARNLFRPLENGSLYLPRLDDVEDRSLHAISAKLNWVDGGVKGQLKGLDAKDYSVEFNPEPSDPVINAHECKTWGILNNGLLNHARDLMPRSIEGMAIAISSCKLAYIELGGVV